MRWLLATLVCCVALCPAWADGPDRRQFDFAEGAFVHGDYLTAIEEFGVYLEAYPEGAEAATATLRLGQCYVRLKDHAKAAAQYEVFLAKYPEDERTVRAHFDAAQAYGELKQPEKALAHFAEAAKSDDARVREEAMVGQGEALIALGKQELAAAHYEAFLKEFPESTHRASMLFTRGWVLQQLERSEEAVKVLEELVAKHPDFAERDRARLLLSDAASAAGDYERAAAVLRELMAAGREGEAAMLRLAWTMYRSGDKAGAAKLFSDFAERHPKHDQAPAAMYNAVASHYDNDAFEAAVEVAKQLQERYPESAAAGQSRFWLGLAFFELKQHAAAAETLAAVLATNTLSKEQSASALYGCAAALAAAGQPEPAIARYRELRKEHPESRYYDTASYSLANLLADQGERQQAVDILNALLASHPRSELTPKVHFALGEHLFFLDRFAESLAHLQASRKAGYDEPKVRCRLGWTQFRLQDFAASLATFRELAGEASAFQQEARYMAGRASEEAGDPAQAQQQYRAVMAAGDGPFAEKAAYSLVFLLEGEPAMAAIEAYLKAFPKGLHELDLRLKLGELQLAAGQAAAARQSYQALADRELSAERQRAVDYGLGWAAMKQDELAKADAYFARITSPPVDVLALDALQQRAEIAFREERYEDARDHFSALVKQLDDEAKPPRLERALYMLGWSSRHLEMPKQAAEAFQQQVRHFPKGELAPDGWLRLAEARQRLGAHAEAAQTITEALTQIEATEELLQLQGDVLVAQGDWQQVIERGKALLEAFPESKQRYLATFRMGLAYKALALYDEAEKHFQATIADTDTIEAAKAQFNIGGLYYSREAYTDAGKQFLRVEMLYDYPELSPRALYHAAEAFVKAEGADSRRAGIYREKLKTDYAASEWASKVDALFAADQAEE